MSDYIIIIQAGVMMIGATSTVFAIQTETDTLSNDDGKIYCYLDVNYRTGTSTALTRVSADYEASTLSVYVYDELYGYRSSSISEFVDEESKNQGESSGSSKELKVSVTLQADTGNYWGLSAHSIHEGKLNSWRVYQSYDVEE